MKYTVIAVGKLKERFWKDACAEYLKRLGGYAKVEVREVADIDPARAGGVDASRNREGASILSSIPDRAHVILLAIEGKERSSGGASPNDSTSLRWAAAATSSLSSVVPTACRMPCGPARTKRSPLAASPCRITWHVWCC